MLEFAWSEQPFGVVPEAGGGRGREVHGLAICKYPGAEGVYRFSCDENWETLQDADYASVEEAKAHLPEQYKNAPIKWRLPGGAGRT